MSHDQKGSILNWMILSTFIFKDRSGIYALSCFHRQCRRTIERSIPILPLWIAARVSHSNTKESNQFLNSIFCMGHKMLEKYLKKHFVCFISTRCHSKAFMAVCSLANWTEIFVPQSQKSFPFVQIILKLVTLHPSFDTRDLLPTKNTFSSKATYLLVLEFSIQKLHICR